MSRISSKSVRALRPTAVMVAVMAAWAMQPQLSWGQTAVLPTGGVAVHGAARIDTSGSLMTVTTTNGAGTSHSAINWQTFSIIGTGATVRFEQPLPTSTSINRVVTSNPSEIFGTLSSNGRLVLVNQSGITVGQGAVIDTAAFTASTLDVTGPDANGKLTFARTPGITPGQLSVDGSITARSGDIRLIGPDVLVGPNGSLFAQGGAAILAAGDSFQVTGRGLEGIVMTVAANGKAAVNLGRLQGDAVAIFAGTLTHSGFIRANSVESVDGKVVLKAMAGDATVDGGIQAFATPAANGGIEVIARDSILGNGSYWADGGPVALSAQAGSIHFGDINSSGYSSAAAGGKITLDAQQDISGLAINASGAACCEAGAKGGDITVTSRAGNIHLAFVHADGGPSGSASGGAGGSIRLSALGTGPNAGLIDIADPEGFSTAMLSARGGFGVGVDETGLVPTAGGKGGSIVLEASRSITLGTTLLDQGSESSVSSLGGLLDVSGGFSLEGAAGGGGSLNLSALGGDIRTAGTTRAVAIGGFGQQPGQGGTIEMRAGGNLALGEILAGGGIALGPGPDSVGGAGGLVSLEAGGNVSTTLIDASAEVLPSIFFDGEFLSVGPGVPTLAASTPSTPRVAASVPATTASTTPDTGAGTGGAGGTVRIAAGGGVTVGGIMANGGSGVAFDDTIVGVSSGFPAQFGTAQVGGAGGHVSITAGGNVTLLTQADGLPLFGILADGGSGVAQGGNAGSVEVKAGGTLTVQVPDPDNVDVLGGIRAVGGDGARGGNGGAVSLEAAAFSLPFVSAGGGTASAGVGGAGGSIALTRAGGDLVFDDSTVLDARGGAGGSDTSVSSGGAGGSVLLASRGGAVRLRSPEVLVAGGEAAANGVNGAAGSFAATGTSVEVEGDFTLDGTWNNASIVNVTGASVVALAGNFNNLAGATLAGTGTVRVANGTGTIANQGTIAPGGDGSLGTLALEGKLVQQAGATLAVDVRSASAFDQLKVSGGATTGSDSRVLVRYAPGATLAPGDSVQVLQAASMTASGLPQVAEAAGTTRPAGVDGVAASTGTGGVALRALAPSAPPPVIQPPPVVEPPPPVIPPPPVVNEPPPANEGGQLALAEVREVVNLGTDFQQGFQRLVEAGRPLQRRDRNDARDDIVVTDTACKR